MKVLSLWQPWASLVAYELKEYETRSWKIYHRGLMGIASTKAEPKGECYDALHCLREFHEIDDALVPFEMLPRGCVLCIVYVVGCYQTEHIRDGLSERELAVGNYDDGRYATRMELVERFEVPIPARGAQGIWDWERP